MIRRSFMLFPVAAVAALGLQAACTGSDPASPSQASAPPGASAAGSASEQAGDVAALAPTPVEFDGTVTAILPRGQTHFRIGSYTVIVRSSTTAIWNGTLKGTSADITLGRRAHVRGIRVLGSPPPAVLASEIRLAVDGGSGAQSQCAAVGAKAEVEGLIEAKAPGSITVLQQGKGSYLCQVDRATSIRKGNKSYSFAELQKGWRVHVKGDSLGSSGPACLVTAREIKVQQK